MEMMMVLGPGFARERVFFEACLDGREGDMIDLKKSRKRR